MNEQIVPRINEAKYLEMTSNTKLHWKVQVKIKREHIGSKFKHKCFIFSGDNQQRPYRTNLTSKSSSRGDTQHSSLLLNKLKNKVCQRNTNIHRDLKVPSVTDGNKIFDFKQAR